MSASTSSSPPVGLRPSRWRRRVCGGMLTAVLWALPGIAAAEDPPPLPGEDLKELASEARLYCTEPEAEDAETAPAVKAANELCKEYCAAKSKLDLCALESPTLAAVAVLVAPDEASRATTLLQKIVVPGEQAFIGDQQRETAALTGKSVIAAALGLGSGSTSDLVAGLAKALAEFVVERAKREALSWTLAQLHTDLCAANSKGSQYFPHLCTLTADDRLGSYAAGAALLEALQGALVEDARSWPGLMVSGALTGDQQTKAPKNAERAKVVERAFGRIVRGNNPALALHDLGIELASIHAPTFKVEACALELPAAFVTYRKLLEGLSGSEPAAMLAALVGTKECSDLIPPGPGGQDFATLGKLIETWHSHEHNLGVAQVTGAALVSAEKEYKEAMDAQPTAETKPATKPDEQKTKTTETEADKEKKEKEKKEKEGEAKPPAQPDPVIVRRQTATVALYGSSIEFTRSSLRILKAVSDSDDAIDKFAAEQLEKYEQAGKLLDAQLHARWGEAIALLAKHIETTCPEKGECESTLRRLGTIAALLAAGDDGEKLTTVLKATAHPPGGWRSKLQKNNLTLSIAAFVGLHSAAELRWGPYGAVVERGAAYWQRPTLAMPIGLDFAWSRKGRVGGGLFASVIDPAAFLGYDQTGKLPGPRPTTVLAPGLAGRVTLGRSPFALLFYCTFRPQYRTWGPTVDGPGASVLQFGINLAADVTLWTITSRSKHKQTPKSTP